MTKDKDGVKKDPFQTWANNDEDDSPFLTDKGKIDRDLVGPETLTRPLGEKD
jgi:hypothetical protein